MVNIKFDAKLAKAGVQISKTFMVSEHCKPFSDEQITSYFKYYLPTEDDLKACSDPVCEFWEKIINESDLVYCGIKWGDIRPQLNTTTPTYISIGAHNEYTNKFDIVAIREIPFISPEQTLLNIVDLLKVFKVDVVACDWGSGHIMNDMLEQVIRGTVYRIMLLSIDHKFMGAETGDYYKVGKTTSFIKTLTAIKEQRIHFLNWEELQKYKDHFLCQTIEPTDNGFYFDHPKGTEDALLHTVNMMFNLWKYNCNQKTISSGF